MYLQTSRLQYNLQGVVLLQTAFSKKMNSTFTVNSFYHKTKFIATCFYYDCTWYTKEKQLLVDGYISYPVIDAKAYCHYNCYINERRKTIMFNLNFKNIRTKKGLSQRQVADYLNVSPQSVSKWETGEALPSIEFLPKMAECFSCEINDFFAPITDDLYDIEMLKEFFAFITDHVYHETRKTEEFLPFIRKYPNILDVLRDLSENMKQHQTLKSKTIQGIMGCSREDAAHFIKCFVKNELIEKYDNGDSYFVVKHAFDGLISLVKIMIEVCRLVEKSDE